MKKTLLIVTLVVALLAVAVMPAAAGGDKNRNRWLGNVFGLVGEVTAVDPDAETFTVKVLSGSQLIKSFVGSELTLTTTEDTKFMLYVEPECVQAELTDVYVGALVSVNGIVVTAEAGQVYQANRVTIDAPLQLDILD